MNTVMFVERLDDCARELPVSPLRVARGLIRAGCALTVVCDRLDRTAAESLDGADVLVRRGERGRNEPQGLGCRRWMLSRRRSLLPHRSLSLTPLISADVWAPGVRQSFGRVRRESVRWGPYIGARFAARAWVAKWPAEHLAVRRIEDGVALLAFDQEEARVLLRQHGMPPGRVQVLPRVSGLDRPSGWEMRDLRHRVRRAYGLADDDVVFVMIASRAEHPTVVRLIRALGSARDRAQTKTIHLAVSCQHQMELLLRAERAGVGDAVVPIGATNLIEALLCCADVAVVPAEPCGPRDHTLAVDALRFGVPVLAGPGAPGADLLDGENGLVVRADDSGWVDAMVELSDRQALARCRGRAEDRAGSFDLQHMIDVFMALLGEAGADKGRAPKPERSSGAVPLHAGGLGT